MTKPKKELQIALENAEAKLEILAAQLAELDCPYSHGLHNSFSDWCSAREERGSWQGCEHVDQNGEVEFNVCWLAWAESKFKGITNGED